MSVSDKSLRARVAAGERWAREPDRVKALAPARAGMLAKWEREADPDGILTPEERAARVESLRKAHYARMVLARRAKRAA